MTTPSKGPLFILNRPMDHSPHAIEDRPVLSIAYKHFDTVYRGIRVCGMWFRNPGLDDDFDPCLVLLRPNVPAFMQVPCVVRLVMLWQFNPDPFKNESPDEMGMRLGEVNAMMRDFCRYLGLNSMADKDADHVRAVVEHFIEDLKNMPPAPPMNRIVTADARMTTHDTGKTTEVEVSYRG